MSSDHTRLLGIKDRGVRDPLDRNLNSTTPATATTKVTNNNEIVMEHKEEIEFEVVSQEEDLERLRPPIQTYVFFDIEATGLRGSTTKARITELALVAVSTSELLELHKKLNLLMPDQDVEQVSARVLNKLILCLNPSSLIMPNVTELTGLDNYNLEAQKTFSKQTAQMLEHFVEHLTTPVCLVAHYGLGFDFPLLQSELVKTGSQLQSDLLVLDSLEALKQVFADKAAAELQASQSKSDLDDSNDFWFEPLEAEEPPQDRQVYTHKEVMENSQLPSASSTPVKSCGPSHRFYQLPLTPPSTSSKRVKLESGERLEPVVVSSSQDGQPTISVPANVKAILESNDADEIREDNEATPDRSTVPHPDSFNPHAPVKTRKFGVPSERFREASRARKRLDFAQTSPQSFSLINLHKHTFGKNPAFSHGAEPDCLALMRVCASQGAPFINYAERHASPFHHVQKMW